MKRVGNLYNNIIDIKKIQDIYDKGVKVNTKNKLKLERFEYHYVSNIKYIKNVLETKNYKPGKYNIFLIKEPKLRIVMSQNIVDKIINHLVSKYFLVDVLDSCLIDTNVATRINKGTHYAIKLLKKYLNEVKGRVFYVLKFDITKYFFNIDHDIVKKLIRRKIKDKDVLNILDNIIDSTDESYINDEIDLIKKREIERLCNGKDIKEIESLPYYAKGRGLPIGNMSSQFLAIFYLNELDHFIKEKLKIKYYIRYMDDGILICDSKEYLRFCLQEITRLLDKYKLKLNKKTKIYFCKEGFTFLGFRYLIKNNKVIMKVSNSTKKRFKRKSKIMLKLLNEGRISSKEFLQVKSSYLGHLQYGNTKKLINNSFRDKTECL